MNSNISNPNDKKSPLVTAKHIEAISYSVGPLPHSTELREYENILPGAAERLLRMAELQAKHRQDLEKRIVGQDSRNSFAGILSAVLICITTTVISTVLILKGYETAGTIIGGASLAGLVSSFIYGTRTRRNKSKS